MFLERKVYLMPFVKTRDHTSLFYQEWGTGEPMLFVHGWCLGADMWEYQMAPLVDEGLRCVAYDVRGCRSDAYWDAMARAADDTPVVAGGGSLARC